MTDEPKPENVFPEHEGEEEIEILPAQAIDPTPQTFGMLYSAVLNVQRIQVGQSVRMKSFLANQDQQHTDSQQIRDALADMRALLKYGAWLLVALTVATATMFWQMWQVILPYLAHSK